MSLLVKLKNTYLNTKYGKYVLLTVICAIILILIMSKIITNKEISNAIKSHNSSCTQNIKNSIKMIIENKKEVSSFIALSLSNDTNIAKALKQNNNSSLNLKKFSKKLEELTQLKNVWFQIIDKRGNSFYRSWTQKTGDNLLQYRSDIAKVIQEPRIMSTISTGKYAMSFKAIVPIYENDIFLGIFEIITHFNFVYEKLKEEGLDSVFIVDKSYKNQITKPVYPLFIDDYYISMSNTKSNILKILQKNGVEKYIKIDKYIIDKEFQYVIVPYHILDINGENMGYILAYKKYNPSLSHKVDFIKHDIISIMIILILMTILFGYYFLNKQHEEFVIKQHNDHEKDIERNTKFLTIGQMAAGITHEINTPLTYIKGTNEMSKFDIDDMPNSALKTTLLLDNKKIADGVNRISNIVESMREMSQVTATQKENSNLYSTLITTLRLVNNRSKHISQIYLNGELFEMETANKEKYQFFAIVNKQKIEQVWTIIINNALDELIKIDQYDKRKLFIDISDFNKDTITIEFQDNGGGISSNMKETIFEPFTSSKISSGIGIGLNVAKKILDDHGATIEIENRNDGALFTIKIKKSDN